MKTFDVWLTRKDVKLIFLPQVLSQRHGIVWAAKAQM